MKSFLLTLLLCLVVQTAAATPRVKPITLDKHTTMTIAIAPGLGTRFIFPFVLDESDQFVPFTLNITNAAFESIREKGRNSFVVRLNPKAAGQDQHGNLFVTVAGYEITVELHTTRDTSQNISDIEFKMSNAAREDLIQQGIAQRTQSLEAEYKKKFDDLDKLADQKSIARVGVLALKDPSKTRIKEESKLTLPNGDTLTLYVDSAITYEPYTIFTFELSTDSSTQGLSILDAKLFSIDTDKKVVRPVDAAKDVPQRLTPGTDVRGVITALDSTLNPSELLKLQVLTDKGTVEAQW